ncbi:MAG: type II toxin-antitoxin system PemK/MazF family toxin [Acidobacteriota bacterium]
MRRGDVRWYSFAPPDKQRPVVVLTRDPALDFLNEVTIAPVTRTIRSIPSEVFLDEGDGMPAACVVNLDHVATVSIGRLGSLITTLRAERMREIAHALAFALDLRLR